MHKLACKCHCWGSLNAHIVTCDIVDMLLAVIALVHVPFWLVYHYV